MPYLTWMGWPRDKFCRIDNSALLSGARGNKLFKIFKCLMVLCVAGPVLGLSAAEPLEPPRLNRWIVVRWHNQISSRSLHPNSDSETMNE